MHTLLNWGTVRYVVMVWGFLGCLAGTYYEGDRLSTRYLEMLFGVIVSGPIWVFLFPRFIAWGKKTTFKGKIWKSPTWYSSPFKQSEPLAFFHFGGCFFAASAIGFILGSLLLNIKALPNALAMFTLTACYWMGLRKAIEMTCSSINEY
jgi:hypothetical protein